LNDGALVAGGAMTDEKDREADNQMPESGKVAKISRAALQWRVGQFRLQAVCCHRSRARGLKMTRNVSIASSKRGFECCTEVPSAKTRLTRKLLFRDLSKGGIIRQHRDVDYQGNFIAKTPQRRPKGSGSKPMASAFDEEDGYDLTELGRQFVHYVMTELPPKIEFKTTSD
jgi:hypothetical protein